MSMNPSCGFVF